MEAVYQPPPPQALLHRLPAMQAQPASWDESSLRTYLRLDRRLREGTIRQRLSTLRFMERHPIAPVALHGTCAEVVQSFRSFAWQREFVEGVGPNALVNDHKAIRTLGAFLGIPRDVWPVSPSSPEIARTMVPAPEDVYTLIHHNYYPKGNYLATLLKGLLVAAFLLGVRAPSELHAMKIEDFDPSAHEIIVREPKKNHSTRRLDIEPRWICCGRTYGSLANYVAARSGVERGGQEALFVRRDGSPFPSREALAKFVKESVQPVFPWFTLRGTRHWCATARLIDSGFDDGAYVQVADWLGHDSVERVRKTYARDAKIAQKRFGVGWIQRVGRRQSGLGRSRT